MTVAQIYMQVAAALNTSTSGTEMELDDSSMQLIIQQDESSNYTVETLPELKIELAYDAAGEQRMLLNGEDVSDTIRLPEVSLLASRVSALPVVRAFLLDMQRDLARTHSAVMDGRDIGTVVLPDAGLKIFLSASAECRAQRRYRQLQEKGIEEPYADVLRELEQRDYDDTHRAVAPLKAAPDAVHIDTSDLTLDESIDAVCAAIRTRFGVEGKA